MSNVSIIIVNYNKKELLKKCLNSLIALDFNDFEIVVVDNGSTDGSVEEIKKILSISSDLPLIKPVYLPHNSGFSRGNLEGVQHAQGKYIALLNNDTEVHKQWLQELAKAMDDHKDVGICASKLIVHNKNTIDSAGDGFARSLQGYKRGEGHDSNEFNYQEYVFGACAGAALYRRDMLEDIGFLDEDFFLIHEDTDINFRAQLAGWKALYVPTAIVYHKVRSSIVDMSDIAVYYTIRNREFARIKNVPYLVFLRYLPWFIINEIGEFVFFALKHKRFSLYFKAKKDALKLVPLMLKKRRQIMKNKRVSNKYIMSVLTPVWEKDFLCSKLRRFFRG